MLETKTVNIRSFQDNCSKFKAAFDLLLEDDYFRNEHFGRAALGLLVGGSLGSLFGLVRRGVRIWWTRHA